LAVLQFQLPPRLQAGAFTISYHGGDTSGLDVELDRSFRAAWIDNRAGIPKVWTSRIFVRPT
jgi:hypothetical protein